MGSVVYRKDKCFRPHGAIHFHVIRHITEPATTISSCTDSPGANCTRLATVLNICSDPHKAKDVCRKYCVLCDMGKTRSLDTYSN